MADLRVDHTMLDNLQRSLGRVAEGLEKIRADRGVSAAAWGGRVVRGSMEDFVGNWDAHREKVTSAVRELAGDCQGVAATFQAVEQGLSRAVAGRPAAEPTAG